MFPVRFLKCSPGAEPHPWPIGAEPPWRHSCFFGCLLYRAGRGAIRSFRQHVIHVEAFIVMAGLVFGAAADAWLLVRAWREINVGAHTKNVAMTAMPNHLVQAAPNRACPPSARRSCRANGRRV